MTPEDRGDGGARPNAAEPVAPSGASREARESEQKSEQKSEQSTAEGGIPDEVATTRDRVEETLRRRAAQTAPDPEPARDRPPSSSLHPPPAASASEHWSWTVRRRVTDGVPGEAADAPPVPAEEEAAAPEVASVSGADEIRDRVERRLREAEDRRAAHAASFDVAAASRLAGAAAAGVAASGSQASSEAGDADDWDSPWADPEAESAPPPEAPSARPPSRVAAFIATCASLGRIPLAPGTFGAAAGLLAFTLTRNLPGTLSLALFVIAVVAGTWAGGRHAKDVRQSDPESVVVDEFCGMWLALLGTNPSLLAAAIAFISFRLLDIFKPPPIRQAERLPGGIGIMADDLLAGGVVRIGVLVFLGM